LFALPHGAYAVILTEDAMEVAAGKKDCSRTFFSADDRFFPEVQSGAGDHRLAGRTAHAGENGIFIARIRTHDPASAGTIFAKI
jgi:hypothetical protein